jgi:L-aspartate oxidase
MWRDVGIQRTLAGLEGAQRQVDFWSTYVAAKEFAEPRGWELQNMLLVSRLIIAGALSRRESRGTHFRSDFPQPDPGQAQHFSIQAGPT